MDLVHAPRPKWSPRIAGRFETAAGRTSALCFQASAVTSTRPRSHGELNFHRLNARPSPYSGLGCAGHDQDRNSSLTHCSGRWPSAYTGHVAPDMSYLLPGRSRQTSIIPRDLRNSGQWLRHRSRRMYCPPGSHSSWRQYARPSIDVVEIKILPKKGTLTGPTASRQVAGFRSRRWIVMRLVRRKK